MSVEEPQRNKKKNGGPKEIDARNSVLDNPIFGGFENAKTLVETTHRLNPDLYDVVGIDKTTDRNDSPLLLVDEEVSA